MVAFPDLQARLPNSEFHGRLSNRRSSALGLASTGRNTNRPNWDTIFALRVLLPSGLRALLAGQSLHGPITREQVEQTLRRIVVEAEREVPVRLRSSGRTARKQI